MYGPRDEVNCKYTLKVLSKIVYLPSYNVFVMLTDVCFRVLGCGMAGSVVLIYVDVEVKKSIVGKFSKSYTAAAKLF